MSYRTFRRRFSEFLAAHDWIEGISFWLGIAFFLVALACAWGIAVAISSLGDPDPDFKTSAGFLQATRWLGIVLFAVLGAVAAGVGWVLAGDTIRRLVGRRARRD
ncbi:MAG TPA: hypothetical protein VJ913_11760 [Actinomycetota bacterium]|nr:hypothetical protein [Actinomycetota bacterium]